MREGVKVPLTITQNNVAVTGFTLQDGYAGIQLHGNFSIIAGNRIRNTQFGIILSFGSNNSVTANIVESITFCGIKLAVATSNLIQKNKVISSGIEITQNSHYNTISENDVVNNTDCGVRLADSDGNTIVGNNITNCGVGTIIYVANDNNFYHNNFVDNIEQVSADEWYAKTFGYAGSKNTLNENFWSDYQLKYPYAKEVDASGTGDTPYVINENNTDYRPLMQPVEFSALVPTPTPTPTGFVFEVTPPMIAVIVAVSAFVIGLVLRVYFNKRRQEMGTQACT